MEIILGDGYVFNDDITILNHKLSELSKIGFKEYLIMINSITAEPYDYIITLSEKDVDYRDITSWQLFANNFIQSRNIIVRYLNFLTTYNWNSCIYNGSADAIIDTSNNKVIMDEVVYNEFLLALNKIHYWKKFKESPKNFGNMRSIKYYASVKKRKLKRSSKKESQDLITRLISFYCNASNSINYLNIKHIAIAQLYDGFFRQNVIQNYKDIMSSIYSGTIKKEKIDLESINWAK